jgi:hypothetical protein
MSGKTETISITSVRAIFSPGRRSLPNNKTLIVPLGCRITGIGVGCGKGDETTPVPVITGGGSGNTIGSGVGVSVGVDEGVGVEVGLGVDVQVGGREVGTGDAVDSLITGLVVAVREGDGVSVLIGEDVEKGEKVGVTSTILDASAPCQLHIPRPNNTIMPKRINHSNVRIHCPIFIPTRPH